MESSLQSETPTHSEAFRSSTGESADRLAAVREEIAYLNTIGKRFVAAFDRFQVHHALLAALQEIYSFTACCILLKGDSHQLFIIPSYPLSPTFIDGMIHRIASAARVMDFPSIDETQLATTAYLDAPDELAQPGSTNEVAGSDLGSCLNIPLTVENHIIGLLSLFDERPGSFDTNLLQLTAMIADYAAIALENVRLRERENALWREAELERQRLELVIRSMAEGLLITDASGAITSLNQSARHMLAQSDVHFQLHRPLRELAQENVVPWLLKLTEVVEEALHGKTVTNQELFIGGESDTVPLTLHVSAAPIHASDGLAYPPIGIVAVLNDVTSIKQVERLKDEFVSVVSHELRTPLTAIKGYTQHLVRRIERRLRKLRGTQTVPATEPPEHYDLRSLNIVQSQTEHLERLVNDLLDLSQLQWGQLQLHYQEFYLADLLSEYVHTIQDSAEQHTLYLDIQTRETRVNADRKRIGQVMGNILDNAIKYSPHGGKVTIRLQQQREEYLISIIDEGIGVSPEHYDHIFERFYRVHNTATQQYSGIGLGLFVTREIITKHGGRIWFTNNQRIGTTFNFTLPASLQTTPYPLNADRN